MMKSCSISLILFDVDEDCFLRRVCYSSLEYAVSDMIWLDKSGGTQEEGPISGDERAIMFDESLGRQF